MAASSDPTTRGRNTSNAHTAREGKSEQPYDARSARNERNEEHERHARGQTRTASLMCVATTTSNKMQLDTEEHIEIK